MPELLDLTQSHQPVADLLRAELARVGALFEHQLASDVSAVDHLCQYVARYRGKMLRPTLTLLSGLAAVGGSEEVPVDQALTYDELPSLTESHRVIAAVCEMIHMATLVHDDILDEAEMRRQAPTVNHLRGNEAAVLLGDYLISNSFHLCSTLGRPEINRRIGETTNTLCAGELLQVHHRGNWSLDERTYFEIIERKTASLIGLCCELGARESGASREVVEALVGYGRAVGIAFQIQDDLLDLIGEEAVVGKTLGKDLEKGKLTLPVILFLNGADPEQREQMLSLLSSLEKSGAPDRVRELLLDSDMVPQVKEVAGRLIVEALGCLESVPASPARAFLAEMAGAVIERKV